MLDRNARPFRFHPRYLTWSQFALIWSLWEATAVSVPVPQLTVSTPPP
jgi:hypothetical protein